MACFHSAGCSRQTAMITRRCLPFDGGNKGLFWGLRAND